MKKLSQVIVFCIVLLGVSSHVPADDKIEFSLTNLQDASTFTAADYRDKVMIIVFGSIYCRPCIQLLPVMNQLHADYKESGVVVVGIDIDYTTELSRILAFKRQHEIAFPFLIDEKNFARQMRVSMLPVTLFVDKGGKVVNRQMGFKPYTFFESELEKLGVERE